jgi:hypothetical protein
MTTSMGAEYLERENFSNQRQTIIRTIVENGVFDILIQGSDT